MTVNTSWKPAAWASTSPQTRPSACMNNSFQRPILLERCGPQLESQHFRGHGVRQPYNARLPFAFPLFKRAHRIRVKSPCIGADKFDETFSRMRRYVANYLLLASRGRFLPINPNMCPATLPIWISSDPS